MTTAIVPGSLAQVAKADNLSLAEAFVYADVVAIVDTSASMTERDSRGGRSRYEVACEELAQLQNVNRGKIAILAFSDRCIFVPGGVPPLLNSNTDLAGALRFARVADTGNVRFVIISDGEPDQADAALSEARRYRGRIDVIYVGPEARPAGREFLQRLAQARGGALLTADRATELAAKAQLLLTA